MFSSSRNAAALLFKFCDERYAINDLWLRSKSASAVSNLWLQDLQLLGLPRRQDLTHGD
jgi:hypothetical protein